MKKKFLACLMSVAMVASITACGNEATQTVENSQETTESTTPVEETGTEEVSVDFEDGNMAFVQMYTQVAIADASELSVADYNGSKALMVTNVGGGVPYVAFDLDSLCGADIANIASIEMTIGTEYADGGFSSASGDIVSWSGTDLTEHKDKDGWSVYIETKNPNKAVFEIAAGEEFAADADNIMMVTLVTDNGVTDGHGNAAMYIDNMRFLDASGNVIKADSSVAFEAPKGFVKEGKDINLCYLASDAYEVPDFNVSAAGWAQAGIDVTEEMKAALVPGSIIEISYSSESPVWLVGVSNGNPNGDWLRCGVDEGNDYVSLGYVASDHATVQYTYEQLEATLGENFVDTLVTLQCESKADWEVFSLKIGQKSDFTALGAKTDLEGFAVSSTAWAQAGIDLTDDMKTAFVPGSVIEVSYNATEPVWLVAVSNGNSKGDWIRCGTDEGNDYTTLGAVSDGKIQFTYEQLEETLGENFMDTLVTLQCESKVDWEVYSVSVGKPIKPVKAASLVEGFAVNAAGWAQAGIDVTDAMKAALVPGSVINISYKADTPVWMVVVSSGNSNGDWLRCGVDEENDYKSLGAYTEDIVQYSYDDLTSKLGDNFLDTLVQLQCESSSDWEVYSVSIGMAE